MQVRIKYMFIILMIHIMLTVNPNYIIIFIYKRVDIRREFLHNIDMRRQFKQSKG